MKIKALFVFLIGQFLMVNAQDNLVNSLKQNASDSSKQKFQFTTKIDLEDSPVKIKVAVEHAGVIVAIRISKVRCFAWENPLWIFQRYTQLDALI